MTQDKELLVYLIAGEPSGDLLASRLMKALREKTGGKVRFAGVGGETMISNGFESLFDSSELAVMGLAEVIPSIPRILGRIRQTVQDIVMKKPDVVITVDSWSFSARVNKALRAMNTGIPQVHYVAPQVWAWKKKRAKTCGNYIDRPHGVWDERSFDLNALFNIDFTIDKETSLYSWDSAMNHAMVLTGVNLIDGQSDKWKIENSWGKENGHNGYYVASDSWFDSYVYQAVVHKKYLGEKALAALNTEAKLLDPWDPMGTLAD